MNNLQQLPPSSPQPHSAAWTAQVWISFAVSLGATLWGVWFLPAEPWVKGYLAMGILFSVGSTLNLAKTLRDAHEAQKMVSRVEEARVERLLSDHARAA